jgi:tight adherence protein B
MQLFIIGIASLMILVFLISFKIENKDYLTARKSQSHATDKLNVMRKNLESSIESGASFTKKSKIELMCRQAGIKMSYGAYKILCMVSSIALPVTILLTIKNEYLSVVGFFIGYMIPGEIIKFKRNKRLAILEKQVGTFLQMVTERYSNTRDFAKAIKDCSEDFKGAEPFYSELRDTMMEMDFGVSVGEAVKNLGMRLGNKYVKRLADYYMLSIQIGTGEARSTLLKQAFYQFEENRGVKTDLKMAITGPANEAYVMIIFIPVVVVYNALTNPDYINFMTTTTLGKIGTTVIFAVVAGCTWLVNTKISAPIED